MKNIFRPTFIYDCKYNVMKTFRVIYSDFFKTVKPIKLTESGKLNLHLKSWGLLSDYYLESVKINCSKNGIASTVATLKIGDVSGQVVCIVRGPTVGLLFGLSAEEWLHVEKLCNNDQQLFYRYFKDGINEKFSYEEKLFYNFCLCNQKKEVFVAVFQRCRNIRSKDKSHPVLEIMELRKCNTYILDIYIDHLKRSY